MGRKSKQTILAEKQAFNAKVRDYLLTTYGIDINVPMDRELGLQIVSILVFNSVNRTVEQVSEDIYKLYNSHEQSNIGS